MTSKLAPNIIFMDMKLGDHFSVKISTLHFSCLNRCSLQIVCSCKFHMQPILYLNVFEMLHLCLIVRMKKVAMHWEKQRTKKWLKTKYGQFVRRDWYRLFLAIVSGDILWKICILSNCICNFLFNGTFDFVIFTIWYSNYEQIRNLKYWVQNNKSFFTQLFFFFSIFAYRITDSGIQKNTMPILHLHLHLFIEIFHFSQNFFF